VLSEHEPRALIRCTLRRAQPFQHTHPGRRRRWPPWKPADPSSAWFLLDAWIDELAIAIPFLLVVFGGAWLLGWLTL
jgi:hypothetical protein